jgi:phage protein D
MPSYTAIPKLKINGALASDELMADILQLSVEESLHLPSMFTIVIENSAFPGRSDEKIWEHGNTFAMGSAIQIGFIPVDRNGTSSELEWVISAEVTAIETHFTQGSQAPIIIRGYDRAHRLHRGQHNRSFQNVKDSDIVRKIIGEVGLAAGTIDATKTVHDYVFQENQTNMEFLRERAARNGFELFVQDGKLHFRKPTQDQALNLTWLETLTSFRVRVSSAEQVNSVEVRGWDYTQKKEIVARQSASTTLTTTQHGKGQNTPSKFNLTSKLIVVDQPIADATEAQTLATALFNERCDQFVHADAQALGDPKLRPGRVVKLSGAMMGQYAGEYYITETQHLLSERNYTTAFSVRGLRGGDLLSIVAPASRPQPGQTLLIGIVTNNNDPKKLGRVRVKLPTLTTEHESEWARVVAIGAGKNRGFDCLPEIDDEVLVGFEHGDIHRPFVIGGLWNGNDAPPEPVSESVSSQKVRLRTFKTRVGHYLQFVDEDKGLSKKGVCIKTAGGHKIYLNDSEKLVEVKTNGGHFLKLDDQALSVSLESKGSVSIKANTSVAIQANTSLDLKATGVVTVQGALIKLN